MKTKILSSILKDLDTAFEHLHESYNLLDYCIGKLYDELAEMDISHSKKLQLTQLLKFNTIRNLSQDEKDKLQGLLAKYEPQN